MSEELKPCPFCGGSPDIFWSEKRSHLKWSVICNDHCLTEGPMCSTEAKAIEAWNTRSDSSQAHLSEAVKVLEPLVDAWSNETTVSLAQFLAAKQFLANLGGEA